MPWSSPASRPRRDSAAGRSTVSRPMRWGSSELEAPPEDGSRTERREARRSLPRIRVDLDAARFVTLLPARGFFAAFLVLALVLDLPAGRFFFIGSLDRAPNLKCAERTARISQASSGCPRIQPVK